MKYIPLIAGPSRPSKLRTRDLNHMKSSLVSLKLLWSVFPSALIFHNTLNLFIHNVLFFNDVPRVLNSELPERFHFLPTRQIRAQLTFSKASAIKLRVRRLSVASLLNLLGDWSIEDFFHTFRNE